jgi:hypothetical protein
MFVGSSPSLTSSESRLCGYSADRNPPANVHHARCAVPKITATSQFAITNFSTTHRQRGGSAITMSSTTGARQNSGDAYRGRQIVARPTVARSRGRRLDLIQILVEVVRSDGRDVSPIPAATLRQGRADAHAQWRIEQKAS